MKIIRTISIILLVVTLMIGACGCNMSRSDNSSTNEVVLNERQKNILLEQGLPTEYNQLSNSQKKAIISIEEMLRYAEEKYDTSLVYSGYVAKSALEDEHLKAYPVSKDSDEYFTITKSDSGYKDDYIETYSVGLFSEYILNEIQGICPDINIKVYTKITSTSLESIPNKGDSFDGTTEGSIWIFVDGSKISQGVFDSSVKKCKQFFENHRIYSTVQLILMKTDKLKYVTASNFESYLSDEFYDKRQILYVKK